MSRGARPRLAPLGLLVVAVGMGAATWQHGTPASRPLVRWVDGTTYLYDLDYGSTGEAAVTALATAETDVAAPTPLVTALRARVEQTLVRRRPDATELLMRIEPVASHAPITCLAQLGDIGQVEAVAFDPDVSLRDRQLARAVLAATQVSWAATGRATEWRVSEADLTGTWCATYRMGEASRRELAFSKQTGDGRTATGMEVRRRGMLHGALDLPAGHLVRLAGETETQFWHGERWLGTDHLDVRLALVAMRPASADDRRAAAALSGASTGPAVRSPLAHDEGVRALRRIMLRRLIGDMTLARLHDLYLAEPDASRAVLHERAPVLEAFLELCPTAADPAADLLTRLDLASDSFSSVAASLAYVGNAAAQQALRRAACARHQEPQVVRRLVSHLAMVDAPEAASEAMLWSLAEQATNRGIASSAALGLGIMGQALLTSDRGRADSIYAVYATKLTDAEDPSLHLRVLGNMGHPRQLEAVEALLASHEPAMRGAALYSLRFVASEAARDTLLAAAAHDGDEAVRLSATEALGHRPATAQLVAAMRQQLHHERAVPVLREVLRNLSHAAPDVTAAGDALDGFLTTCGHPSLCDFARGLRRIRG